MLTKEEIAARKRWWQSKIDHATPPIAEELAFWRSEIAICDMAEAWRKAQEQEPVGDTIDRRRAEMDELNKVIGEKVADYEFTDGDGSYHDPTDCERVLIEDFLQGILVDDAFLTALCKCYPIRSKFSAPPRTYAQEPVAIGVVESEMNRERRCGPVLWFDGAPNNLPHGTKIFASPSSTYEQGLEGWKFRMWNEQCQRWGDWRLTEAEPQGENSPTFQKIPLIRALAQKEGA